MIRTVEIVTQLRSYQQANNVRMEVRDMAACAADEIERLRTALTGLLDRYCDLVNSGDCGFWNPEDEKSVKAARRALAIEQAKDGK